MDTYVLNIILGIIYLISGLIFVKKTVKRDNKNEINTYFLFLISFFYIGGIMASSTRYNYFNLRMMTPISNISPMLFTLCIVCLFSPLKIRKFCFKLMAIFNVVMIVAGFVGSISCLIIAPFYFSFVLFDELAHLTYFLFVFYLVKSNQVIIKKSDLLKDYLIVGAVVLFAFILNLIFDTSFFGLCLNDNYSIYGIKIFNSYIVSDLVYLFSLIAVMFIGYFIYKGMKTKQ